jgi:hypothetical protein
MSPTDTNGCTDYQYITQKPSFFRSTSAWLVVRLLSKNSRKASYFANSLMPSLKKVRGDWMIRI